MRDNDMKNTVQTKIGYHKDMKNTIQTKIGYHLAVLKIFSLHNL